MSLAKKNTATKNSGVRRTKQNRLMLLTNCIIYGKKKIKVSLKPRSDWIIEQIRDQNSIK